MGFFDSVRDKVGALAGDAERAGKVTAAQARLAVLQSEMKKAERELGRKVYSLVEAGELDHPELTEALERVRAVLDETRDKEGEIAALHDEAPEREAAGTPPGTPSPADRSGHAADAETGRDDAPTTVEGGAAAPGAGSAPASATVQTAAGPVTVAPAQVVAAAQAEAELEAQAAVQPVARPAGAATPAEGTGRGRAAGPAGGGAKKAPAKKAAVKKATAKPKTTEKVTPKKGASGKGTKAGSTPKKGARPSSAAPRPAGKKRPGGA